MSNNIYDILKKFNSLDSVKNTLTEGKKVCKDCGKAKCECVNESKGSKPDYIDLDKDGDTNEPMKKAAKDKSKGAIAEAVARVEQNLAEKYQGFKNIDEGEYNEDMLSPGQKKIARMSPPPNKIDAGDFAALRKDKKSMKKESLAYERNNMPPKDLDRLERWAGGSSNRRHFSLVAKFGIINDMNLQQTLEVLQNFDDEGYASQYGASKESGSALYNSIALFNAYENVYDAWIPPDFDYNEPESVTWAEDYPGMKKEGAGVMHFKKQQAQADGKDSFKLGDKEYKVQEGDYKGDKPGQTNFKPPSPYTPSSTPDQERAAMYKKDNIPPELQANNSPAYQNWRRDRDEAIRKGEIVPSAKTNEGFPTVDDAKKRMDAKAGKTAHGTKTVTKTGVKHERNYDADEPTGERGRPKKDKFAK